ncbi:DMT family transporter [Desulfonatronovibrio hydrogenovorans]|uniref:DMT family transporter n=1 Tax=Desulfonatronovibrio hydrogenovorans TaxID=53245 RepID=UPI000558DF5A|nr:DMT family transporter [Desulfonatronovibrio hydrogenovorans]
MDKVGSCRVARLAGLGFALGATVIWSGNFIVARGLNEQVNPATLAMLRWLVACLVLFPLAGAGTWKDRQTVRVNLGYLLSAAFLGVTVFNTLIYIAAHTSTALNLSLIATSTPIFIIIFSRIFLGEPITWARSGGLVLAVSGVVVLITRGDLSILRELSFAAGDLWMVAAAMIFGGYTILIRIKPAEISQATMLMSTFGLGLAMLMPWAGLEIFFKGFPAITMDILGSVLYIGIGASLVSFFFWAKAISLVGPSTAGLIYYTLPLFSGLGAFLLLGEPIGWIHALSGVMILGGIAVATRW